MASHVAEVCWPRAQLQSKATPALTTPAATTYRGPLFRALAPALSCICRCPDHFLRCRSEAMYLRRSFCCLRSMHGFLFSSTRVHVCLQTNLNVARGAQTIMHRIVYAYMLRLTYNVARAFPTCELVTYYGSYTVRGFFVYPHYAAMSQISFTPVDHTRT